MRDAAVRCERLDSSPFHADLPSCRSLERHRAQLSTTDLVVDSFHAERARVHLERQSATTHGFELVEHRLRARGFGGFLRERATGDQGLEAQAALARPGDLA